MTGPSDAKLMQDPESLEVSPGFKHEKLEGWVPELAGEEEVRQALEKAFDYRGDVTITRKDGSKVEGYIFDRRTGKNRWKVKRGRGVNWVSPIVFPWAGRPAWAKWLVPLVKEPGTTIEVSMPQRASSPA